MPPASLSTLAVMIPGPTTNEKTSKCLRNRRKRLKFTGSHFTNRSQRGSRSVSSRSSVANAVLSALHHHFENIVGGDNAKQMVLWTHHGQGHQVVLVEQVRHHVLVGISLDGNDRVCAELFERRIGLRQQNAGQGYRADQRASRVHQKNDVDGLQRALEVPQGGEGTLDGGRFAHHHELRGHESAGGLLLEAQELAHLLGPFPLHVLEKFCRGFWSQLLEHVSRLIRRHFIHNVCSLLRLDTLEQSGLHAGGYFR